MFRQRRNRSLRQRYAKTNNRNRKFHRPNSTRNNTKHFEMITFPVLPWRSRAQSFGRERRRGQSPRCACKTTDARRWREITTPFGQLGTPRAKRRSQTNADMNANYLHTNFARNEQRC